MTNKRDITIGSFYKQLYSTPNQELNNHIPKVLNQGMKDIPQIDEAEIMAALKSMKTNKAPSEDGLVIESIKNSGLNIIKALKIIFNKCLLERIRPSQWENAQIIILHKKWDNTDLKIIDRSAFKSYLQIVQDNFNCTVNKQI